jgi:RND family efflux transporter MFP subunit
MRLVLRWSAVAAVVGLGATLGGLALAADDDPAARYRLATASLGDVAQSVSTSGTVDYVNRADVSFGTGGRIAELSVAQGDRVTAGQRLGALDTSGLSGEVDAAEAELAAARATLAADQQRQAEALEEDDSADADADPAAELAERQQGVRTAKTAADRALAAAATATSAQAKACAEAGQECTTAISAAMSAQEAVAAAQDTLQQRIGELTATLESALSEMDAPTDREQDVPTAATIAADQAAVDGAEAKLVAADQALARATLTAPIAGTVASVSALPGDDVAAGDAVLVLVGAGAAVVEATVPVERVASVRVGQPATVTPTGSSTGVPGKVTRIGRLPDDALDSVAYPVTITVDEPPASMPAGSSAGVAIVVATAEGVLTVPTSALAAGPAATVTVLAEGQASVRQVSLGVVGPLRTEITEGLAEGERVVLADLEAPLPSGSDELTPGGVMVGGPGAKTMPGKR